jgi:hypothetical protein
LVEEFVGLEEQQCEQISIAGLKDGVIIQAQERDTPKSLVTTEE